HDDGSAAENAAGMSLQCIFAPRAGEDAPWLALLPRAAPRVDGFIADDMEQTHVRRFLLDEHFAYDPETRVGLAFGASLGVSANDADALFNQAAKAKARLILRVTVPLARDQEEVPAAVLTAFRAYLADAVKRSRDTLAGIVIAPEGGGDFTI